MEKSLDEASQEFQKFLVGVIYENQSYFAVWGTDTVDHEQAKWLIDTKQSLLFFDELQTLKENVALGSNFLDHHKVEQWVLYLDKHSTPNTILNFDLLTANSAHIYESLRDLYHLIGLIEDFAIQVDNVRMRLLFENKFFKEFKDEAANTFLWQGQDEFDKKFDFISLSRECRYIYNDLKDKISFVR